MKSKIFEYIVNIWNNCQFCKKYKYWMIGILIIIGIFFIYWFQNNYKFFDEFFGKRDKIIITLNTKRDLKDFENLELKIDNEVCERTNKDILEFECDKPKKGEHKLQFGEYTKNIIVGEDQYSDSYDIDKRNYFIKEAFLNLSNNNFNGKVLVVDKEKNAPKYTDTKNKFDLKIYESTFNATIKNAEILFSKPWEEFSKIYYLNNTFIIDFEIENEKLYSYKPYFLTKGLNIDDLFSFGQNNENIIIKDVLKIKDNSLEVFNYSKKLPNINLFKVRTDEIKNGYIKFRIRNMNKDNVFNLYMNTMHIFKYEYPNFKFDIREIRENDNTTERVLIGNQSFIQNFMAPNEKEAKFNKGIIKELFFLFEKTDNNCKLTVNADKYKKVSKEFLCEDDSLNQIINSQLHIENSKCTNNNDKKCVLFEISDLETGLDFLNSPTRNYSF